MKALIVVAAFILAAAIVGSGFVHQYAISPGEPGGNPFVWRLNVITGEVEMCQLEPDPNPFENIVGRTFLVKCRAQLHTAPEKK